MSPSWMTNENQTKKTTKRRNAVKKLNALKSTWNKPCVHTRDSSSDTTKGWPTRRTKTFYRTTSPYSHRTRIYAFAVVYTVSASVELITTIGPSDRVSGIHPKRESRHRIYGTSGIYTQPAPNRNPGLWYIPSQRPIATPVYGERYLRSGSVYRFAR
eukprot:8337076-Pyramimonas_sp.AAC.1